MTPEEIENTQLIIEQQAKRLLELEDELAKWREKWSVAAEEAAILRLKLAGK